MASLSRAILNVSKLKKVATPAVQSIRHAGYWNEDWKPGPYPVTEEQRQAAARRYGLLPEDYEPYPDDGCGYGDYPKLPIISAEHRDPFYPYDFPAHRRDFGEVLHVDAEWYGLDRIAHENKIPVSEWTQAAWFFGYIFIVGGLILYGVDEKHPHKRSQLPHEGGAEYHFTFDKPE